MHMRKDICILTDPAPKGEVCDVITLGTKVSWGDTFVVGISIPEIIQPGDRAVYLLSHQTKRQGK